MIEVSTCYLNSGYPTASLELYHRLNCSKVSRIDSATLFSPCSKALKYSTGMRSGDLDKFGSIASATIQMTRLTEDLLWLARSDGIDRQQWARIDLTQVLTEVLQAHQALALSKKIDLQIELAPELMVIGDRSQLLRVFTNLIENALHYTLVLQPTYPVRIVWTKR